MEKNKELWNDLKNAEYGDIFFCGFKDHHNDVDRLIGNKLINNMELIEFIRKEKCKSYVYGWDYYFLEFDIMNDKIKEVKHFIELRDDYWVSAPGIISKYPLTETHITKIRQEQEAKDAKDRKLAEQVAEWDRLDDIQKDNELRERMG